MIASRGINCDLIALSCVDKNYGGFSEGEFFDDNEFEDAVRSAFKEALAAAKCKIKKIVVGIPNSFLVFRRKKFKITFGRKKRIRKKDVEELISAGEPEVRQSGYEIISRLPITFGVNGKKVFDPIGFHSSELGGFISYVLADASFINNVNRAVGGKKGIKVEFVCENYTEGAYFLRDKFNAVPVVVADIGYITSSFSLLYGGGIVADKSVDSGGGYITAALVDKYSLPIEVAEELKRKINLGLKDSSDSFYKIQADSEVFELPVGEVNSLTREVIDDVVGALDDFIEQNSVKFQGDIKVYLTGGGISRMRGAKSHVSARIGIETEILTPSIPEYDKPERSSLIALASYAIGEK